MHTKSRKLKKPEEMVHSAFELLPDDRKSMDVLLERANRFSKINENVNEKKELELYVRFRLGKNEYYGIPYHYTCEVMNNFMLTPVPCAPPFVAGVINRRGALLTVINLKHFFHVEEAEEKESQYIIIVKNNLLTVGILADEIKGGINYDPLKLECAISSEGIKKMEYIKGLHQSQTTIINVENVLSDCQLTQSGGLK